MGHGGTRKGSGRPKGSIGKRSLQAIEEVRALWPDWSPLKHLAFVANNETLDPKIRLDAAKAAAPYFHPRPKGFDLDPSQFMALFVREAPTRKAK